MNLSLARHQKREKKESREEEKSQPHFPWAFDHLFIWNLAIEGGNLEPFKDRVILCLSRQQFTKSHRRVCFVIECF